MSLEMVACRGSVAVNDERGSIANSDFVKFVYAIQPPTREDYVALSAEAVRGIMPTRKVILATMEAAGIPAKVADEVFADVCSAAGPNFGSPLGTN